VSQLGNGRKLRDLDQCWTIEPTYFERGIPPVDSNVHECNGKGGRKNEQLGDN